MTWPYWLAIGVAAFALGTLVDERIGAAFDRVVVLTIAAPILVVLWTWDALAPTQRDTP